MSIESVRLRKNFMACGQKRLFRAARRRQTADLMAIITNYELQIINGKKRGHLPFVII